MQSAVDIGTRTELFVDDFLVDRMDGTHLQLQHPERREVVFVCDAPWEDNVAFFNSVFQDGPTVRLYYRAGVPDRDSGDIRAIALAESTDGGRSFARPSLGLVEFQGTTDNNLLSISGSPHIPPSFIDPSPASKPEERYKGLSAKWKSLYAWSSADGLHWRLMREQPIEMEGTFDTVNTAFWDARCGCYRSFTRYFENLYDGSTERDVLGRHSTVVRGIQSSTSQDFVHWTPVVHHEYNDDVSDTQLYTNATLPCPGAEHIYIAFPNRYVQDRLKEPGHPSPGVNDALFMASRDCIHWRRYLEAWVRPGLDDKNWTDRNNYPTWGLIETSATEWSMYISEHYRRADARPRLRRLSIRPHGFVSIHADYAGGECVTRPLLFGGRELCLNCSTSAAGAIRVEIQDWEGHPVDGFSLADADVFYGDALDATIRWNGRSDLTSLTGRPVRFRFALQDADVFAMRTTPAPGGEV